MALDTVRTRRYDAVGPAFVVSPTFASSCCDLSRTAVAFDAAGNFGIVWTGARFDDLLRLYEWP